MTHGVTYLPQTDVIIVLKDGEVTEVGDYESLLNQNGAFAEFLRNYFLEEDSDEDDNEGSSSHVHFTKTPVFVALFYNIKLYVWTFSFAQTKKK